MSEESDAEFFSAFEAVMPALLVSLEMLGHVARHLHPPEAKGLADWLKPQIANLGEPLKQLNRTTVSEGGEPLKRQLLAASDEAIAALTQFVAAAESSGEPMGMYRALRRHTRAVEALFPLADFLAPVSRFFLEPEARGRADLLARLQASAEAEEGEATGFFAANNERDERGGFSLYVPSYYDPTKAYPLVMCMHGGSGHGADFIWSWLREARTRGFVLVSPTSVDRTWSIIEPEDQDVPNLQRILSIVFERYNIDRSRMLLTGMSDGGTYSGLAGFDPRLPFTHLAPFSGVAHPFLMMNGNIQYVSDKPIHWVHGTLDWMFPADRVRNDVEMLRASGANLIYRELPDLSHTYAREMNAVVLDWLGVPIPEP